MIFLFSFITYNEWKLQEGKYALKIEFGLTEHNLEGPKKIKIELNLFKMQRLDA